MKTLGIKPECFLFGGAVAKSKGVGVVYVVKNVSESFFLEDIHSSWKCASATIGLLIGNTI